jgi:Fe-S oxidoreductase
LILAATVSYRFSKRQMKFLSNRRIAIKFSVACANRVLNIWESAAPTDKIPRGAIIAVMAWLEEPREDIYWRIVRAEYDVWKRATRAFDTKTNHAAYAAMYAARSATVCDSKIRTAALFAAASAYLATGKDPAEQRWQYRELNRIIDEEQKRGKKRVPVSLNANALMALLQ